MWQAELDAESQSDVQGVVGDVDAFREEALAHYIRPTVDGQVLEISPPWVLRAHWSLVLAAVCLLLFASVASVRDFASGPAMVRLGRGNYASVVALIPGQYRPQIKHGDSLRLNIVGYPQSYETLVVTAISNQVMGVRRAAELLGADALGTQGTEGGVVIVEASLPNEGFRVGTEQLQFYDGMVGRVEIEVGSRRLIHALISAF
jgi:hypothetical protein